MLTQEKVMAVLSDVYDPELMVSIVDLGLVYGVRIGERMVTIEMTLTSVGCPAGEMLERDIRKHLRELPGIEAVEVEFVWDPPWEPSMMTEEARLELGYDI
ncbi:MAG: metal-sulfur cluster assembly factor [Candidatus Zhuqueibacterota bacterium]